MYSDFMVSLEKLLSNLIVKIVEIGKLKFFSIFKIILFLSIKRKNKIREFLKVSSLKDKKL